MGKTEHALNFQREMHALADSGRAEISRRFFKTGPGEYGEGDRFLGLRVPQVRSLARQHRTLPIETLQECLQSPWHEERLLALFILVEQYRRGTEASREAIYQTYLASTDRINNWDLVDSSAEHIVGAHIDPERLDILEHLAGSSSLWERRIGILATFHWIKKGNFRPTVQIAKLLLHDSHDLIHKAVGWMLREVGKRDLPCEEAFLVEHYRAMPRTMLRYALERFPESRRQDYLLGKV